MFRILTRQFGYPMYAANVEPGAPPFSDVFGESHVYDGRDNPVVKLAFWRGLAKFYGLDPERVEVVRGWAA